MSRLPYYFYKIYRFIYCIKIPFLSQLLTVVNRIVFGAYIPPSCQIGQGTRFAYGGSGCVVHARAVVGRNCILGPCSTIGGRSKVYEVPVLGDNVYLGGGAKVLGNVKIGNNVVIGANAVVIKDVPDNCIVAGVPAKILKKEINPKDYV